MVDPAFWFQFTRAQKEVNKLPGLAEDKETRGTSKNKVLTVATVESGENSPY